MNHYPKAWIATLFFTQGLPFSIVTIVSTLFYKDMGIANHTIIIVGSLFFIPWIIKPIASPLIESLSGKYQWTIAMQLSLSFAFLCLAIAVIAKSPLGISALIFFIIACLSALHDTASDGIYLLNLNLKEQYKYVSIRNCFYLMARLLCQSGLVYLAYLFGKHHSQQSAWGLCFFISSLLIAALCFFHSIAIKRGPTHRKGKTSIMERIKKTGFNIIREWRDIPHITLLITFFIIYSCTEAQLIRIVPLFFMDSTIHNGLHLKLSTMAITQFVGVFSLLAGSFFVAYLLGKKGLKKTLNAGAIGMLVTNSGYFLLSETRFHPISMVFITYSIAQFFFGFSNSAFIALLMKQAGEKKYQAAYFSLATAVTSLGFILFGLLSAAMLSFLDYKNFFIWIFLCGLLITAFTKHFNNRYKIT